MKKINLRSVSDFLSGNEKKHVIGGLVGSRWHICHSKSGCENGPGCPDWLDSLCIYGWACAPEDMSTKCGDVD